MIGAARHFLKEQAVDLVEPVLTDAASYKPFGAKHFKTHMATTVEFVRTLPQDDDSDSTGGDDAGSGNESAADREIHEEHMDNDDNKDDEAENEDGNEGGNEGKIEGNNDTRNDIRIDTKDNQESDEDGKTSSENEDKKIDTGKYAKQQGGSSVQSLQKTSSYTRWGQQLRSKSRKTLDDRFTRDFGRLFIDTLMRGKRDSGLDESD